MKLFAIFVLPVALLLPAIQSEAEQKRGLDAKVPASFPELKDPAETVHPEVRWLDSAGLLPIPVAIHPDGHQVAVQSNCETIVYDLRSGKRLHSWLSPTTVTQFSCDGRFLLTNRKGEIGLWDAQRFVEVHRYRPTSPLWQEMRNRGFPIAALSDHADVVAISNSYRAFDLKQPIALLLFSHEGKQSLSLEVPDNAVIKTVSFISKDRLLLSYENWENKKYDSQYMLWDIKSGELVRKFDRGATVKLSRNGKWLAAAKLGNAPYNQPPSSMDLSVWSTESGELLRRFERSSSLRDFAFHPDSRRLLMPVDDRLGEWDVQTGILLLLAGSKTDHPYASVAYSPNGGRRFATVEIPNGVDDDVDHFLRCWNVATGNTLPTVDHSLSSYNGTERLFFFPKGDRFIDLASGFAVRDVLTGAVLQSAPGYRAPQREVAFMPDGEVFMSGYSLNDPISGNQRHWSVPAQNYRFINGGRTLFSADHSGVFLTDVVGGAVYWKHAMSSGWRPWDVGVSADASRIVVSYRQEHLSDSRLIVIDPAQPDTPLILPAYASAVAVHPDSTRFVTASHKGVDERNTETGVKLRTLWKPPGRALFITYSSDGNKILAGGVNDHSDHREKVDADDDGWVAVYDTITNKTTSFTKHSAPVTTGEFSADGSRCATGSMDRTIRLWNSGTGQQIQLFRGHKGAIHRIAYSPRGDRILSAGMDGAALWHVPGIIGAPPFNAIPSEFEKIESIDAYYARLAPKTNKSLFANSEEPPVVAPSSVEDWPVIEVGNLSRIVRPLRAWLSRARETKQVHAEYGRKKTALPGYDDHGASRNGQRRVLASRAKRQIAVVGANGEVLSSWQGYLRNRELAISASGRYVAIARKTESPQEDFRSGVAQVTIYDVDSGDPRLVVDDIKTGYVHSLKIDPNEKTFLLQIDNNSLELRNFQSGQRLAEIRNTPAGAGLQSGYSPNGKFIATCKFPLTVVHLRDPKTLKNVLALENHLPVRWFDFTPDGRYLLAGQQYLSHRHLITKWDVETGKRIWSRAGPAERPGKFSSDGQFYLTKCGSYVWTLWDNESGDIRCVVVSNKGDVLYGQDEGRSLRLVSGDGTLLWSDSTE